MFVYEDVKMTTGSFRVFSSYSRFLTLIFVLLASTYGLAAGRQGTFPIEPNETITPGKVCDRPTEFRYAEHIAYCERNVSTGTKAAVIRQYDVELGFSIEQMERMDFKIDHFIPLCMGGSNDSENLWPQHKSVYVHTDPIEQGLCDLMVRGQLSQSEAMIMIRQVKHDLSQANSMISDINQRLRNR